jgi:hypothetical protein
MMQRLDAVATDDVVFPVRDDYVSSDNEDEHSFDIKDVVDDYYDAGNNGEDEGDDNEDGVICDNVYNVVDPRNDDKSVCSLVMTPVEPTTFESQLTLAKKGVFDNSRKKNAVWYYYGHLCPDKHPKSTNITACVSCLRKGIDKHINMDEKNPSCAKLVQHLRHNHLYDGMYTAFKADTKTLATDAVKSTPNKMSQSPIKAFHKDNNIIKLNFLKMMVAKWVVATNQPLNAGESTAFKEMIQLASDQQLPVVDNMGVLQII